MARGLRLLSGQSKAAQESAGARLRPHKVMKVAGHARGPETPEQGHSCARAHRAHSACVLSSTGQCRAFLRPPRRDPNSHAHSRQLPLSRERGPAAGRQAQRRPDRSPLSAAPFQVVLAAAPPEPLGLGVDGSLCRQARVGHHRPRWCPSALPTPSTLLVLLSGATLFLATEGHHRYSEGTLP